MPESKLHDLLSSIIEKLKEITATETVIGKPVSLGDKSVVPVTRVIVGFGVGGGEGEVKGTNAGFGGGGGGGAKVEPVGFIIIDADKVSFLPTSRAKWEGLIDAIPDLITKIKNVKKSISEDKQEKKGD